MDPKKQLHVCLPLRWVLPLTRHIPFRVHRVHRPLALVVTPRQRSVSLAPPGSLLLVRQTPFNWHVVNLPPRPVVSARHRTVVGTPPALLLRHTPLSRHRVQSPLVLVVCPRRNIVPLTLVVISTFLSHNCFSVQLVNGPLRVVDLLSYPIVPVTPLILSLALDLLSNPRSLRSTQSSVSRQEVRAPLQLDVPARQRLVPALLVLALTLRRHT